MAPVASCSTCCRHACKAHAVKDNGDPIEQGLQANATAHMMAPSARTRTRWHKAHAPRASAAATSVRESRNTASRRASASRHPPSRVVAAKLETAGYGCFFRFQVVLHLVDRQDAIADHLCKEEARTVAMPGVSGTTKDRKAFFLPGVNGKNVHSDILITGAH
jgi:hypothetical protein